MWAVWVVTTGSLAAKARNFSSSSASTTPSPQEPVPSSTGPEDHHLPGFDQRLPVRGVTGHDLALFFGHVEREGCARRLKPEAEGGHTQTLGGMLPQENSSIEGFWEHGNAWAVDLLAGHSSKG